MCRLSSNRWSAKRSELREWWSSFEMKEGRALKTNPERLKHHISDKWWYKSSIINLCSARFGSPVTAAGARRPLLHIHSYTLAHPYTWLSNDRLSNQRSQLIHYIITHAHTDTLTVFCLTITNADVGSPYQLPVQWRLGWFVWKGSKRVEDILAGLGKKRLF